MSEVKAIPKETDSEGSESGGVLNAQQDKSAEPEKGMDICFVVDCTASMGPFIEGVRDSIYEIVNNIRSSNTKNIRLAFVGYRDITHQYPSGYFRILDFTANTKEFQDFVANVKAKTHSPADWPEDVFGGLEKALELAWGSEDRIRHVFHICDAPGHGSEIAESEEYGFIDRYHSGDPLGRTASELFSQIKEMGIIYHFGRITETTDKMIEKFSEIQGSPVNVFQVCIDELYYDPPQAEGIAGFVHRSGRQSGASGSIAAGVLKSSEEHGSG